MNASPERTPPSTPSIQSPPVPLWRMLEDEFRAVHGDALKLDAVYEKLRDDAIGKAKAELRAAIQQRVGDATDDLDAEVEREISRKPELMNGPACRELFQRVHRFVEEDSEHSNKLAALNEEIARRRADRATKTAAIPEYAEADKKVQDIKPEIAQAEAALAAAKAAKAAKHSALCLSGGGIRSATFALGVLQALARKNILPDFAYLSTVSGGGYIGSWLSSWIQRSEKNSAAVFTALGMQEKPAAQPGAQATTAVAAGEPKHPFATEPSPIQHLRKYSNYLTPSLGLLSGDGWAVAATVARNLLLNWILIVPALLLVLLMPRIALGIELDSLGKNPIAGKVAAAITFLCGVYALSNLLARRGKTQGGVLWHCVFPIVLFSAFATLAWFWARSAFPDTGYFKEPSHRVAFYMGWGALTALLSAPLGVLIRKCQKQRVGSDWLVRVVCMVVVFALAGLAACWMGVKAAAHLKAQEEPRDAKQAEVAAPVPASPEWALLSRQEKDFSTAAWVEVQSGKVSAKKIPSLSLSGPSATTDAERRLNVAILSTCFGFPLLLSLIFVANTVLTGLLSRRMRDEDREWLARASGWAFLLALVFCAVNLLVFRGPDWLLALWATWPKVLSTVAGGSALLTIGGGRSDKMAASERADEKPDSKSWIFAAVVKFAAPLFVVTLLMLFSLLTTILLQKVFDLDARALEHWRILERVRLHQLGLAALVLAIVAAAGSLCVNINKFSLHAMYRNRLIRAYLGATNRFRAPNLFTGFDPADNLELAALRGQRPFHVVNTALNLVGGTDLAWQQRMAMSFTMTPLTCGSATLGYRDSQFYARAKDGRGMTLGTALAISGAAVSPNHGYNSSPLIAFLLTFFNARLGGWFGNPGPAGAETWTHGSPAFALQPLVSEAFGLTDAEHPHVYLSDGGHFENLGLYEMVLRRCRAIVISDAGCDPEYWFEDLGNAISKIRVDLGIRIVFPVNIDIRKFDPDATDSEKYRGRHCAFGQICYSDVDGGTSETRDGTLIYLKPTMCGWEPLDVYHYYREHRAFPHEPTTDQWFSESQFESYRTLGFHTIELICKDGAVGDLATFAKQAAQYVTPEDDDGARPAGG